MIYVWFMSLFFFSFLWGMEEPKKTLLQAVEARESKLVEELLAQEDVDVNMVNDHGQTPLIELCWYTGQVSNVERLLHKGAHINHGNRWGDTALLTAAYAGDKDTIQLLLEEGAIDYPNNAGKTASSVVSPWQEKIAYHAHKQKLK